MPTSTSTNTQTITELLSHLIRMPTVTSDHATNRAALDWVEEQLHDLPLSIKRIEHNGVASLVATSTGVSDPKRPKLWLAGHMDVVPGQSHDFEPVIRDSRLYGRGAYDMKYGLAIFIALLQNLGDSLADYSLGLMVTSDEEHGGFNGAGHLAKLGYGGPSMLLPECGIPWNMEAGAKSISWWKFQSRGQTAHAAYNWRGRSATEQLIDCLALLKQRFPTEPCGDPEHHHHTMNIGTMSGGQATNQVADSAEATVDIRALPEVSLKEVRAWVDAVVAKFPHISVERTAYGHGFITHNDGAAKAFRDIAENITGQKLTNKLAPASSDARFFAPHGTQVIAVPPLGGDQHSSHEWIDLASFEQYSEIVRRFTEEWAGPDADR